jgi:integrase
MPLPRQMRRRRNGVIYVTIRHPDGYREERTTGSTSVKVASKLKERWELDASDPDHARTQTATLSEAIADFIKAIDEKIKAGKLAAETKRFYSQKLGHLVRVFEALEGHKTCEACDEAESGLCSKHYRPHLLHLVDQDAFDRLISVRRADGVEDTTIWKELGVFVQVMKRAKRSRKWRGDIDTLIPEDFEAGYVPRERWLTAAELQKLLAQLIPDRAARVAFIVATSAETSATDGAQREDLPENPIDVLVRGTKREKRWRRVPVIKDWQRQLLAFVRKNAEGTGGSLFRPWGSDSRDLKVACERAGVEPCSPNDLRRTFSHWMRQERIPLEILAPMMGHVDTTMLQRVYGKLTPAELLELARVAGGAAPVPQTAAETPDGVDDQDLKISGNAGGMVSAVGIEPTTRGLRVPTLFIPAPRKDDRTRTLKGERAAPVPQRMTGGAPVRLVRASKKREP